jgi:tetratricopeptide (TPR) repeat protein
MNRIDPIALLAFLTALVAAEVPAADVAAGFHEQIGLAEASLREGELELAESQYRDALRDGWLLLGTLARTRGRAAEARAFFERASAAAVDNRIPLHALALSYLQSGDAERAVAILRAPARARPEDGVTRRLLARALAASGHRDESLRELEAARARAPKDAETLFALAAAYLGARRSDDAARLFDQLVEARPGPRTRVLVARTYRDAGEYSRARAELEAALVQDPATRRAHLYLGTVAIAEKGRAGLEEAIPYFERELELAPGDPLASLELGVALVDTQDPKRALPPLEVAARAEPGDPRTLYYLGRAELGSGREADAVATLQRALEITAARAASGEQLRVIHNQLGQALRAAGRADEAAAHFAEAQKLSARSSEAAREQLARQADAQGADASPSVPLIEDSPVARLTAAEQVAFERDVKAALARTYLNLGVMLARGERFARAASQFENAAALEPESAQVQSSLGIAYFNARRFDKAAEPLSRALAANPSDGDLKRMLAMTRLNTQEYAQAAELLGDDPELRENPSLRFAYGLALAKSNQAARAEQVFGAMLRQQGDTAELSVLLGKAYAQMGDFGSAIAAFQRALALRPDVAEAEGALGVIYFKQGRIEEAEAALRAELRRSPGDLQSRQNLAQVLDAQQRPEEALPLLRDVLAARPDLADARYLLGKVLLAQGAAADAVEQLEAAARLAPQEANVRYQLGRAYARLGRAEDAQREFELVRQIKARR